MKQTFLFVDAADIIRTNVFDLHLIFTDWKLCDNILSPAIPVQNSENFFYSRAMSFLMMLITGSMFWP